MTNKKLIEEARHKAKQLQKLRRDPRYLKTIGKLRREGFLDARDVPKYHGQVFLQDALWAAELEPRIYELLPAIVARRPKFFAFMSLPVELDRVVKEIKTGHPVTEYQGVAPEKYNQWVSFVGRKSTAPKVMKAFRLSQEDIGILSRLAKKESTSQTQILRRALKDFASRF